jgi:uncharacterized protein
VSTRIQHALVTGASAGLGAEFARQLADRGVSLTLVARRQDRLEELGRTLRVPVEVLPADLATEAGVATVAERLAGGPTAVDLLVNNAGFGAYGPFTDLPLDRQRRMVDLNVRALVELASVAAEAQVRRGEGGIINVGSTAGFQPDPFAAVYGATKAFVRSFSEALHEELRDRGVRVLLLAPGFTETEFQDVAEVTLKGLPEVVVTTAEEVVAEALAAFADGRAVCVPGTSNKLGALGADITPSVVTRRVSKAVHGRITR